MEKEMSEIERLALEAVRRVRAGEARTIGAAFDQMAAESGSNTPPNPT